MFIDVCRDTRLPIWLKENIKHECPYCGANMEVGYNKDNLATGYRCPNKECTETLAVRAAKMLDLLNIAGAKEATCRNLIKTHNLKHHFDVLSFLVKEIPEMTLGTFLRIHFIGNWDTKWDEVSSEYCSVSDLESSNSRLPQEFYNSLELLKEHEDQVNIIQPIQFEYDPIVTGTVMITNSIQGFVNRDSFVHAINRGYQGLVRLKVANHKKKYGVMALIKEDDGNVTPKTTFARENHIRIMTPNEFLSHIQNLVEERVKEICE